MSPVVLYVPTYLTAATRGGGDSGSVVNRLTNNNETWSEAGSVIGNPGGKSPLQQSYFSKIHLGPTAALPGQTVIPAGSTINSAKLTVVPVTTGSAGSPRLRAVVANRQPTAFPSNAYRPINTLWFDDEVLYGEHSHYWIFCSASNGPTRVDDLTTPSGVGGGSIVVRVKRLGADSDEGVHSVEQKMVITDPGGGAIFDSIRLILGKANAPTTEKVWVEIHTEPSTGPGTNPNPPVAISQKVLASSFVPSTTGAVVFNFDDPVDLGSGSQTIYVTVTTDATSWVFNIGQQIHALADYPIRYLGRCSGFMDNLYPMFASFPHVTADQSDVFNSNRQFSVAQEFAGTWTATIPLDFFVSTLGALIQSVVDDQVTPYVDGDPFCFIIEMTQFGGTGTRSLYQTNTPPLGPYLTIDFTPFEIVSFTGAPTAILVGGDVLLQWEVTGAGTSMAIDNGIGSIAASGMLVVSPTTTTTYTLTAINGTYTKTAEVTIVVSEPEDHASGFSLSETSIANAALILLGEHRIDSLNDESKTAKLIAEQFNELRDQLLRYVPWAFATKRAELALDATPPAWGFGYSYTLPVDCLRLVDVDTPIRQEYRVEGRAIVTDIGPPLYITYTKEVVDVGQMDVLYRETLAAYIAAQLAEAITGSSRKLFQVFGIFEDRLRQAVAANAQEQQTRVVGFSEHDAARGKIED